MVWIGLLSYSAYLWHQSLFASYQHRADGVPLLVVQLSLASASLALAWMSWRFVEAPFRQPGTFGRRQIFTFSAAASALFLAVGVAGHLRAGFADAKLTPEHVALLRTAQASPKREACHTGGANYRPIAEACAYPEGDRRWAVFGDSHAVELAYALSERLRPRREQLVHLSFSGCVPSSGQRVSEAEGPEGDTSGCARWTCGR
jgi:hypothetical protein